MDRELDVTKFRQFIFYYSSFGRNSESRDYMSRKRTRTHNLKLLTSKHQNFILLLFKNREKTVRHLKRQSTY